MKIAILGSGYVGLVSGACLSEFGHQVVCIDTDAGKIERLRKGEIPIYEPGLDDLVARNVAAKHLSFSNDIADSSDAQAVFIAVGTPTRRGDGHADMQYVYAAAEQIAKSIKDYTVIITKSTVPVGTSRAVSDIVKKTNPKAEFDVASNPEFLREGSAIEDFMRPDRVVIGISGDRAREVMRQIYRPLFLRETPILFTKLETSELIKYSANAFLAMKITFINQVSDLCEKVGADVHDVARGIGLDGRIGNKFLHPSPGFGGSCFPKDTRALIQTARDAGSPLSLIEATLDFNEARKREMADRILAALGSDPKGKTVAVLGLTFKPNTDDMREAASITILPILTEKGVHVRAHDPEGMHEAKKQLPNIDYCDDAYDTMKSADVLVILTEWNSYRSLDLDRVKSLLKSPVFIDLRNIYRPDEMAAAGFRYSSLGRTA